MANWYNLKPIKEYDLNGEFVREFNSITEASHFYNYSHSSIAYCVCNKNITCNNKIFVPYDDTFLKEKINSLKSKQFFLYDISGNLIDTNKCLTKLYKKYNLNQRVNEFSKRVWNGLIPTVVKSDYFITTPNTDYRVILERINIYHLYTLDGVYVRSFPNISHIAMYLKCNYTTVTEHTRGRLKSVKNHIVLRNNEIFDKYEDSRKKKINCYKLGILIKEFNSLKEASDYFNIDGSCISKCCLGKRKSTKGYEFRYVNDIV